MAIPQGRMSTVPIIGEYLPPEGVSPHPFTTFERGPVDVEDTTEGLLYQDWQLVWEPDTHDFVLTARTTLQSYIIGNSLEVTFASFTFDKTGRVTFAWTNDISSYLYWYDTEIAQTVTTDLGSDVITPSIYLDDKRATQDKANDMLLWYTKYIGGERYALYMKRQRDRFITEFEMATNLEAYYIVALGMTYELRIQITLWSSSSGSGTAPPLPDPDNLDFESGDVNWTHASGTEFSINQNNPETGTWNATLNSTGAYSRYENDTYFPVVGGQEITIRVAAMGTVGQGIGFGFRAYDSGYVPVLTNHSGINVTAAWVTEEFIVNVPATAAYIRLSTASNGLIGTFHIDNFTLTL